jgi:hypothetical protein
LAATLGPLPRVLAAAQQDRNSRRAAQAAQQGRAHQAAQAPATAPAAATAAVASPVPLPVGVVCAGRVPWGATRYFDVRVDGPNEILTLTLVATTPTLHAAQAQARASEASEAFEASEASVRAPSSPRGGLAASALGRAVLAVPGAAGLSDGGEHGGVALGADDDGGDDGGGGGADSAGRTNAVWTTEEVARRRPAGLAKADLFVRKVRPEEEGQEAQRLPSPSDFDLKSCSAGARDRVVVFPGSGHGGGAGR